MAVEGAEEQGASSPSSPASAAQTPGGLDEDGATGVSENTYVSKRRQSSEATPVCPAGAGPEEGTSGEL